MSRLKNSQWRRRGMAVLLSAIMMTFMIPIIGLAIDAGVLYSIKAKLSAASDAAALAAARSLHIGLTIEAQQDTAKQRAEAFFAANFPKGMMATANDKVVVKVEETAAKSRSVTVTGSVDAPTYFMRVMGLTKTTVAANGKAVRRDVNVLLVLDRSGSLQTAGACDDVEGGAISFVSLFANQRDRMGLITFGGSSRVDYAPNKNFKTSSPTLIGQVDTLFPNGCNGWTGSAQALWRGYQEIVDIAEPGALNVILFFTDGIPNAITAEWNVKTQNTTSSPTGKSHCWDWANNRRYDQAGWNPVNQLYRGFIAGQSGVGRGGVQGFNAGTMPVSSDPGAVSNPIGYESQSPKATSSDCYYRTNTVNVHQDIPHYPNQDIYGNSVFGMPGGQFKSISLYTSGPYNNKVRINDQTNQQNAAINAVDHAAYRIRQKVLHPDIKTLVYVIGLGGAGEAEHTLLRRIANDPQSTVHDQNAPTGMYVYAPNASQLNAAFISIASEILRIAN
ncbi:MAG: VWA domain-containing protein [Acidimicrobiia bacterium]|nr:VWA domain-containing protein [Acidimicrobiia bacterium]